MLFLEYHCKSCNLKQAISLLISSTFVWYLRLKSESIQFDSSCACIYYLKIHRRYDFQLGIIFIKPPLIIFHDRNKTKCPIGISNNFYVFFNIMDTSKQIDTFIFRQTYISFSCTTIFILTQFQALLYQIYIKVSRVIELSNLIYECRFYNSLN